MRERNPTIPSPEDETYSEWLRYLVQSAPEGAPELDFLVSLWSYALKNDGLTPKQQTALKPYIAEAKEWIEEEDRRNWASFHESRENRQHEAGGVVVPFPKPGQRPKPGGAK